MENLELTPVELMSALNWKKSKVYYWINTGKFQTVERMGITKVVISQKDLDSLKKFHDGMPSEKFDNFSENFENSNNFQNNLNQNVKKHYENFQESFYKEQLEFFKTTLETIKQMHYAASQNYDNGIKLLTDSQSAIEQENFRLNAECKTLELKLNQTELEYQKVSENLKQTELEKTEQFNKFKKVQIVKNVSIIVLIILFLISLGGFILVSNNSEQNQDIKKEPAQQEIIKTPVKPVKK